AALTVQLGRAVGDRKRPSPWPPTADFGRGGIHRGGSRVAGGAGTYGCGSRGLRSTARITRLYPGYAVNREKHSFNAPEAATGQYHPGVTLTFMQLLLRGRKPAARHREAGNRTCVAQDGIHPFLSI